MSGKKKILYVQTSGVDQPERAYAPFILASTAAAMNIDATVYFVIKGVTLMKKGEAEKIKMGSFPSLKQVMDQAVKAGVKLVVCEQSCGLLGIQRGDFTPELSVPLRSMILL
jgi:predicted peroxiredoxin